MKFEIFNNNISKFQHSQKIVLHLLSVKQFLVRTFQFRGGFEKYE
jgi:hypothetical protein